MVKLTKIYTRTGDEGKTHLAGGKRVPKSSLRIQAIGDVDELNSWIGTIIVECDDPSLTSQLLAIQQQLFNLGAQLAILPEDRRDNSPCIVLDNITNLEKQIDAMNEQLPMLNSFILPGGNRASAYIHLARAVCRRAERTLFALHERETIEAVILHYINRLSDWLFVAARHVCRVYGIHETLWKV